MINKLESLKLYLKSLNNLIVAFSGGVDSTFLLKVAHDVLGDKVYAVTAKSEAFPDREFNEAQNFTKIFNINHTIVTSKELEIEGFSDNPINRCYLCKRELFTKIIDIAKEHRIDNIAEGSNLDDLSDYRPGLKAIKELGIRSPLKEVQMTKYDIRLFSREMGLATWDKQSFACLSSRFPYGEKITKEKLRMVDIGEQYLFDKGFKQVRVRYHQDIARIEVMPNEREKFFDMNFMDEVFYQFKGIGFKNICLDLKGYRTGSLNEGIFADGIE